jgi:deoxyhypusine synthase
VATGSVYVHADVTAVFPWVTYALLSDPKIHKKPRRLYDAREQAVATLSREVTRRRRTLAPTLEYDLPAPGRRKARRK